MVPSQPLDHLQDPPRFSPRSVSRLDEEHENESSWDRTLRPAFDPPIRPSHSRDSSADKTSISNASTASTANTSVTSPRIHIPPHARNALGGVVERVVDPKSATYGHHRQTSIVHGIQHSRNGSLASTKSSPLSPHMIAAAGAAAAALDRPDMDAAAYPSRPPTGLSGSISSSLSGSTAVQMERSGSAADLSPHAGASQRKQLERMHSKSRRDHGLHHSLSSRHHKDDPKTVGEYALHVLFTAFIAQAEEKLTECITVPFEPEPDIEQICGPGVDPGFDQAIVALGHIARPRPKALIDSMMLWRKSKSDAANDARNHLQQPPRPLLPAGPLLRRNTEPVQQPGTGSESVVPNLAARQEFVFQAERRSTVSIYILCRVLLEVISQSSLSLLTPEMEDKLETIIFGQLKIADTDQLMVSGLKLSNWNLFAQLLGHMSSLNFVSVNRRYLEDLEASLQERIAKSPTYASSRDTEAKVELVLSGMKHLKIRISPEESWEQSCDFLTSLGRLFNKSHGQRVKWAFCQILDHLLLRIASKASNSHFMHPKWAEVIAAIGPRLAQMFMKPRHWSYAFPLTASLLCVSTPDNFGSQWLQLILPLQTKIKDRSMKPLCLQVISRLLWTYLYRSNDNYQTSIRKTEEVMKLALPTSKRSLVATETSCTEPLIQIIRLIGFKYPEYCFRTIIFPLINAELFTANKDLRVEQLDPDRVVVGIKAFLYIMSDLEKGEQGRPPFPQAYEHTNGNSNASSRAAVSPAASSPRESSLSNPKAVPKEENVTRPVLTHVLTDSVREYYIKFCEILGKITIICDNTFGGQAALDEKFNSPGPKTPITETFTFSRKDDHQSAADQKQAFYELLHVAVQALPRCLSVDIPFNSLINLLCTGTAHVQSNIATSSANSLKAIARQSHAQQVTMGFARFIFNFDDRYSTMSDGGMLGHSHIENTLRLYVELLQIWIEEIRQKTRDAAVDKLDANASDKRGKKLDISSIWAEVDQAEAHGLFFLCSQSRRVRHFAVTVLRLIVEFDIALGKEVAEEKDTMRLIDILEKDSSKVMEFNDEQLTVAERSRLQRGLQSTTKGALVELCSSDVSYDTTLWFKVFPNLIRIAYEKCPFTVTICRDLICNRILQMYKAIVVLSEPARPQYYANGDPGSARLPTVRSATAHPEVMVEQWKLYLIFACTSLADPGAAPAPQDPTHVRKNSKSISRDKIVTARTLFKYLIPLLSVSSGPVRDAVVTAMGSINIHIYRTLLEELQGQVSRCNDEARARMHQRTNSSPRRNRKMDLLRTEITHVFKLTSHFLKEPDIYNAEFFLATLTSYTKDLKLFLMDGEVQMDWEFQQLRRHYCGLMEALFDGVSKTQDPSRWMTFESRKSAFSLMEDWCGFSPNQNQIRAREDTMRQSIIDQQTLGEQGTVTAAMEIEKRNLRTAALSSMAALCGGPISVTTESSVLQFDMRRMLGWIEAIFNSGSDRMNVIGRRALQKLIVHNQEYPYLMEHCIARCYLATEPKVLESYFSVVTQVLQDHAEYPCTFWKLVGLCLFTLGSDQSEIRSKSSNVLRSLEAREQRNSKVQDFDISISDKTQAVYKLAQFEISKRLANHHTELAFHIFSEFTLYFKDLQPAAQRNVVAVALPWIQAIELKLDPNGGPTTQSYVLLANLLEITIKSSGALHNEVQALWQALATGPHGGNVRLVLDFIMQLCLERREQNFVGFAKQIVVFLSTTNSTLSCKVIDYLLMHITPKAMVPHEKGGSIPPPPDLALLPYCADLSEALPMGTKQAGFSLGQLSLILLVDLMVSPVNLAPEKIPLILQVVTVLWDHYTPLVQEQAREMLVHLIHELVISQMDDQTQHVDKKRIEDLIDLIRRHDRSVVWGYEDSSGKVEDHDNKVPRGMEFLTAEVLKTFEMTAPGIKENWGQISLTWATSCPVRHLACRSFQIFRCVLTSINQEMLGDMLARLSNTIADEDPEIRSFSMEILTTLKTLIVKLDADRLLAFPQLFWTTCACLESINEKEFLEAVEMLDSYLAKVDFRSPSVRRLLADGQPGRWEGKFEGLQPVLHKGLRSSLCFQPTLDIMDKVVQLPNDALIGDDTRLFFSLLANFPRFCHELERGTIGDDTLRSARILLDEADSQGLVSISRALHNFLGAQGQESAQDFMIELWAALKEYYSPRLDFQMVKLLMGFLTNSTSWIKIQTMRILCIMLPELDIRKPELSSHGSDLISPLLRLLQTDLCMEGLEVMDHLMHMPGNKMDKQHVRMSLARSTSRTLRKEYERTQSLFGIPEASGWAIPTPAKKTESTRANIHAAFYTCQGSEDAAPDPGPTPEVEFHADDFPYGYFGGTSDRTETMMSDEGRGEVHVGDLVTKLDSLDDFFDEASDPNNTDEDGSLRTITEFAPESGAELYDEQILPILHEASNATSFQNGFADRSPVMSRESSSNTMNPGAFNSIITTRVPRPGLHSRSITSPSAPASYHAHMADLASDDEYVGGFSDADDERPSTGYTESAPFFLENMINPAAAAAASNAFNNKAPVRRQGSKLRRMAQSRSHDERVRGKPPPQPITRLGGNQMLPPNLGHQGDML